MTNRLELAIKVFDYSQMWKARVSFIYTGNVGMPKQRQVVRISLRVQTSVSKVVYISTKTNSDKMFPQTLFSASKLRFQGVTFSAAVSVSTTHVHTLKNERPCYRYQTGEPPVLRTGLMSKLFLRMCQNQTGLRV